MRTERRSTVRRLGLVNTNSMSRVLALAMPGAGVVALLVAGMLAGCGSSGGGPAGGRGGPARPGAVVVPRVPLGSAIRLPARAWAISFDARVGAGSRLQVDLGYRGGPLVVAGAGPGIRVSVGDQVLTRPAGWLGGGWWHVEATNAGLAVDGRGLPVGPSTATTFVARVVTGRPQVRALIATAASAGGLLLLHRVAELHARLRPGQFPEGATVSDRIVLRSTYWTSGFWPGALWQAAALAPAGGMFERWALAATVAHFGQERAGTHDVGFMYGQSSLAAWQALCAGGAPPAWVPCARLRRSVLAAADELRALAAGNAAGAIPTDATSPEADTIVDSMMNIAILPWATRVTGNPGYARLALRHAHLVARLLVRGDGSTAQAVYFDRRTGHVLSVGTHQGLSDASTWSRGQGWAVYGFAEAADEVHDRGLLRVAVRTAGYVASHLPPDGMPRWDYDAPAGAPVDVSAGMITAAGLLHLAAACRTVGGVCGAQAGRWAALGRRMLSMALQRASDQPPLGLLRDQVLNEHGHGCWCNGGELIFGVTYGLEAVRLGH